MIALCLYRSGTLRHLATWLTMNWRPSTWKMSVYKHQFFFAQKCIKFYKQLINALWVISIYYINTSEITSELSRENFISSHVKITWYLHTWRYHDHHCFSYVISEKVPRCLAVWSKHYRFFLSNLQQSSEIFGNLQKMFGECSETFVWPSDKLG